MTQYNISLKDPAGFFLDTEQRAGRSSLVRTARITKKGKELLGLCLLDDTLPEAEKKTLLDGISRLSTPSHESAENIGSGRQARPTITNPLTGLPHAGSFRTLLEAETKRQQKTRLPCSMLLIKPDASKVDGETVTHLAAIIQDNLHTGDTPAHFDGTTFAVILPNTNCRSAFQRAERIRKRASRTLKSLTVSIGVGICSADETPTDDALITMTMQELQRAFDSGGDRVCRVTGLRQADSCQVTVEERAHLFNFFGKG